MQYTIRHYTGKPAEDVLIADPFEPCIGVFAAKVGCQGTQATLNPIFRDSVIAEETTYPTAPALLRSCGRSKTMALTAFATTSGTIGTLASGTRCKYPRWSFPNWYGQYATIWIHKVAVERCHECRELYLLSRMNTKADRNWVVHRCPSMMAQVLARDITRRPKTGSWPFSSRCDAEYMYIRMALLFGTTLVPIATSAPMVTIASTPSATNFGAVYFFR